MRLYVEHNQRSIGGADVLDLDTPDAARVGSVTWTREGGYTVLDSCEVVIASGFARREEAIGCLAIELADRGYLSEPAPTVFKRCCACGVEKWIYDFPHVQGSVDRRSSQCATCYDTAAGVPKNLVRK